MVGDGLDLPDDLLALVAASHSGEEIHLDGARRILASAGLTEDALQTPPDWPADEQAEGRADPGRCRQVAARHELLRQARRHARHRGAQRLGLVDYRDPAHPVQLAARDAIGDLSGETPTQIAVDGCGAPAFAITLTALARSFGRLAVATRGRRAADRRCDPVPSRDDLGHPSRRVRPAPRDPGTAHQGRRRGGSGRRSARRPRCGDQDQRRHARARGPCVTAAVLQQLGFEHPTLDAQAACRCSGTASRSARSRSAPARLPACNERFTRDRGPGGRSGKSTPVEP